ncbi:MAG: HIT domain-containing protein [Thermoplasmataceae archaeon]
MENIDCIFCEIVQKKKESFIFYEDKNIMGLMDLYPVENGHSLIIPKEHFENIFDIDKTKYIQIHNLARILAMAMRDSLGAEGINIGQNNGECANQRVNHYHLHIIPRWKNNDLSWARIEMSTDQFKKNSEKIKASINALIAGGMVIDDC